VHAAYLNQGINLIVTVLMVPLLLRHLTLPEYVLWTLFTTIGAVTLQFESAIQNASTRRLATSFVRGNSQEIIATISAVKVAYRKLAFVVACPIGVGGLYYLSYISGGITGPNITWAWLVFVGTYAVNYWFGVNNSILLGAGNVVSFNAVTSVTRVINIVSTYAMFRLGLTVLGICFSFSLSVAVGSATMRRLAARAVSSVIAGSRRSDSAEPDFRNAVSIPRYVLYTMSSFALYRGLFLIVATVFPKTLVGAYGLTLQAVTLIAGIALVPLQVWLNDLVRAIVSGNKRAMTEELRASVIAVNLIFVTGLLLFGLTGNWLLAVVSSKVQLVTWELRVLVFAAFLVEVNIFVLVNFLVTMRCKKFLVICLGSAALSMICEVIVARIAGASIVAMVAVPLIVQSCICLPRLFILVSRELATKPLMLLGQVCGRKVVEA